MSSTKRILSCHQKCRRRAWLRKNSERMMYPMAPPYSWGWVVCAAGVAGIRGGEEGRGVGG